MTSIRSLPGITAVFVLIGACLLNFIKQAFYPTRTPGSFS